MACKSTLCQLAAELNSAGVEEAEGVAGYLLSQVAGCRRLDLEWRGELVLTPAQQHTLEDWTARIKAGEPLQYVLGDTEFLGRLFKTDARALIPRPETELLVEWVLSAADLWRRDRPSPVVVDVGTGTGCIAISLALARPEARLIAVDLSGEALALARENAERLGAGDRVEFRQADLLAPFAPESLEAVVSNPPYIAAPECDRLPRLIREHEPRLALDGGADGLFTISRLVKEASVALKSGGRLFMEMGEDQADRVRRLLSEAGFAPIEVRKDFGGHQRMVGGTKA